MLSLVDAIHNKLGEILDQYLEIKERVKLIKAERINDNNELKELVNYWDKYAD